MIIVYKKCTYNGDKAIQIIAIEGSCLSLGELPLEYLRRGYYFYNAGDYIRIANYACLSKDFRVGGILPYTTFLDMIEIMQKASKRLAEIKKEYNDWVNDDPIVKIVI